MTLTAATPPPVTGKKRRYLSPVCRNGDHDLCDGHRVVGHLLGGNVKLGRCRCDCHRE